MAEPTFDVSAAHRWFAIECNNRAWDLVEQGTRTAAETSEMIDAAHAARLHWKAMGNLLNELRAECLLATVHVKAADGPAAVRHAERCLHLSEEVGETATPFDLASAHGCAAYAYALAGQSKDAQSHAETMVAIAAGFDDVDDRAVIERLYPRPVA